MKTQAIEVTRNSCTTAIFWIAFFKNHPGSPKFRMTESEREKQTQSVSSLQNIFNSPQNQRFQQAMMMQASGSLGSALNGAIGMR